MFRFYYTLLAVLAAIWFVLARPGFGLWLINLTFGLAVPLFFAPTLLIYLACLAPMLHLWPYRATRSTGVLASAVAMAVVALVPGLMSERRIIVKSAELRAERLLPGDTASYRSLEFDRVDPDSGACGAVCRHLMRSGQLDWVRVAADPDETIPLRRGALATTVVRAGFGAECVIRDPLAVAASFCPIVVADQGAPAALVWREQRFRIDNDDPHLAVRGLDMREGRLLTLAAWQGDDETRVLANRAESADPYVFPTVLEPEFGGGGSSGAFPVRRRRVWLNGMAGTDELAADGFSPPASGLPAGPNGAAARPPSAAQTRTAVSVLDLPIDAPFNRYQEAFLAEWAERARHYPVWNAFRLRLAGRLLLDQRVSQVAGTDQLIRIRPVADRYLGGVLALVEAEGVAAMRGGAREAMRGIAGIDIDILARHKQALIRLSDRYDLSFTREPVFDALRRIDQHEKGLASPVARDRSIKLIAEF